FEDLGKVLPENAGEPVRESVSKCRALIDDMQEKSPTEAQAMLETIYSCVSSLQRSIVSGFTPDAGSGDNSTGDSVEASGSGESYPGRSE
ncbi:hypothetical protein J7M07_00185, partial [bacterium]|nr:hypothetical protein [bacterium]